MQENDPVDHFHFGRAGNNLIHEYSPWGNCDSERLATLGDHRKRYTGPDHGELRVVLLSSHSRDYQGLATESDRYDQALAESRRLGTRAPLMELGLFQVLQSHAGWFDDTSSCQDEPRFCPRNEVGTPSKIRIKVLNRDPSILISAESNVVNEGQPARFILERRWNEENLAIADPPGTADTRVLLRTSVEGEYVTGVLPTEVTFGLNETRKVIELATVGDSAFAADGSVTVEVLRDTTGPGENIAAKYTEYEFWVGHTPEGGRSDRATVTIRNDDTQPGILISDARVSEGGGSMVFDVALTHAWSSNVTMNWATSDGTATAGSDYTASSGAITVPHGDTTLSRAITVAILNDSEFENNETFTITLSEPVEGGFPGGDTATATGTIEDNDLTVVTDATLVLSGETPPDARVGDEITLDFQVSNIGDAATGANIVVETNRDGVSCAIATAIAPGGVSECQTTFTVTAADLALESSEIRLVGRGQGRQQPLQ